jgi:hypothetical protein
MATASIKRLATWPWVTFALPGADSDEAARL